MKIAFFTLGCKVNQYESQAMAERMAQCGYEVVPHDCKADIYVINSCTVTAESDRKTRQTVRRFKRKNPDSECCRDFVAVYWPKITSRRST